jgi:hypothetical protein
LKYFAQLNIYAMNNNEKELYKMLMTEIVQKQTIILGPQIAFLKARKVSMISINDQGKVLDITGDPKVALQALVDEYVKLSGQIVKNTLGSIFTKYPQIQGVQ